MKPLLSTLNFITSCITRITSISKPDVQFSFMYGSFSLAQKVKVQAGTRCGTFDDRIVIFVNSPYFNLPLSHSSIRIGFNVSVNYN